MSKPSLHRRFILGLGLALEREYRLRDDTIIRPARLNSDIDYLKAKALHQQDYGFLCSLADSVSFELEVMGESDEEVAIKSWNAQWDLILFSIIGQWPIYFPLNAVSSRADDGDGIIKVTNIFFGSRLFSEPKLFTEREIALFLELEEQFHTLLSSSRFTHAASVASNNFNEPKPSMRMAAIWSAIEALLGFDHELRFRIAVAVSRLLEVDVDVRKARFEQVRRLYDLRSKSVHGADAKRDDVRTAVEQSLALLCELLLHFIRKGAVLSKAEADELFLGSG